MTRRTSAEAFADAVSAMTTSGHVGDILTRLVSDCAEVLDVSAVALLVADDQGHLDLLASSSAAAAHLEMLQVQDQRGPCVDAIRAGRMVSSDGRDDLTGRWGEIGTAIAEAGVDSVQAYPLMWRGRPLGGLNVFGSPSVTATGPEGEVAQAFADLATVVLVHFVDIPPDQVTARVREAVMARSTIEQAKGVLAELHRLDMEQASARLQQIAGDERTSLTETALRIVREAHGPNPSPEGES